MKHLDCPPDWCDACGCQSNHLHHRGLSRLCTECARDGHDDTDDWRDMRREERTNAEDR